MKKTLLVLLAIIVALAVGCSDDAATNPDPVVGLPQNTQVLQGIYKDQWDYRISATGLYDAYYKEQYSTEIRFDGVNLYFRAVGVAQIIVFSGKLSGGALVGKRTKSDYTPKQGIIATYPPTPHTYTRL
jgi:hypothetical protein